MLSLTRSRLPFSHACLQLTVIVCCLMCYTVVARLLHQLAQIHAGLDMAMHLGLCTMIHVWWYMLVQVVRTRTGIHV